MMAEFGSLLTLLAVLAPVVLVLAVVITMITRYKRCPSDMVLVVYGRVGEGQSSLCIHGGGKFVIPVIQDYAYLSLVPMTISIPLVGALSLQNIRVNVPSTFTVGVSTQAMIMNNAAERLLNLRPPEIEEMAKEIIFGQLRLTVASLTIEQINQDRESFYDSIRRNVEPELNKIGLYLINVNITDISDESDYIESIGKKAASEAIQRARVDVADQEKMGAIGWAEAEREKRIRVAENETLSAKGQKKAEADQRIYVQQQETMAALGEADAERERQIKVAEYTAETVKGTKKAEADQRIYIQAQEAEAVAGENKSKASIADYNAELAVKAATADQKAQVARRLADVEIQKAQYKAEQERMNAEDIVKKEMEKREIVIAAEAEADRIRRVAQGKADGQLATYTAEAEGLRKVLDAKAAGYAELVRSCGNDARAASTLLMIEKIEELVAMQVEAISKIKIDKITVWDSGGNGDGNSTANFASSLIKSLPPLHDVAAMAGLELPEYLGTVEGSSEGAQPKPTPPAAAKSTTPAKTPPPTS